MDGELALLMNVQLRRDVNGIGEGLMQPFPVKRSAEIHLRCQCLCGSHLPFGVDAMIGVDPCVVS